jgi:hypothetical protein
MKAKELIAILEKNPDFDVVVTIYDGGEKFPNMRTFENIELADVGHSSKVIVLTGDERE